MLTFFPSVILGKFQRLQIFDYLPNFRGAQSVLESRHPGLAALDLLPRGLLTPLGDQIIIEQRSISSVGRQRGQMANRAFLNKDFFPCCLRSGQSFDGWQRNDVSAGAGWRRCALLSGSLDSLRLSGAGKQQPAKNQCGNIHLHSSFHESKSGLAPRIHPTICRHNR